MSGQRDVRLEIPQGSHVHEWSERLKRIKHHIRYDNVLSRGRLPQESRSHRQRCAATAAAVTGIIHINSSMP